MIDLDQYKRQAKELLRRARAAQADALARLRQHHPAHESTPAPDSMRLADAQLVIARENGFATWSGFKEFVLFRDAVGALDSGDLGRLQALIEERPSLLRYRCRTGAPYEAGYFAGATLLHHIAGNPDRGPLPSNILDGARLLIRDGFDPTAAADTIALLLTSKRAAEAGVALPLIDLLMKAGALFDLDAPGVLSLPLLNAAPATAEALVRRGAKMDLRHATALGKMSALAVMLAAAVEPGTLEEALAYACICGQREAASLLAGHGARGDVLVSPGGQTPRTALHEAANRGFLEIAKLLLDGGADATVVEPHWGGTAADWADHGGHPEVATLLRQNVSSAGR